MSSLKQIESTGLGRYSHPDFRITWMHESIPHEDPANLLSYLERRVAAGERFRPGETVQVGWIFLRLSQADPSHLEFEEPDFRSFPIQWTRGADQCLRYLRRQTDVVRSFDPELELCFPTVDQAALVCDGFKRGGALWIEREQPAGRLSGWYFTCQDEDDAHDPKNLKLISLYQAALDVPPIVQFLAIPPGHGGRVNILKGRFSVDLGNLVGEPLRTKAGSYLDQMQKTHGAYQ